MPDKTPKPKQIMDVSHPGTKGSQPTSRPIIVSNRPVLKDPMMLDNSADATVPDSQAANEATSKPTKLKIAPLHDDVAPQQDDESAGSSIGAPKLPVEEVDEQPTTEPTKDVADAEPSEKPEETSDAPAETKSSEKPAAEPPQKDTEEPTPATRPEPEATDAELAAAKLTDSLPDEPTASDAEVADQADAQLADLGKPDAKALKAAKEAEERQLALDTLVADETYFLPVDRAGKRRAHRLILLVVFVVFLIAALVAVDLLMDAGILTLGNFKPLTDVISNQ